MLFRKQQHTYKLIAAWLCSKHYIGQRFSKSGLWSGIRTGREFNPDPASTWYITQTFVWHAWHTHTHTHTGAWTMQCLQTLLLLFQTKHIATSDILDKPELSFSGIMSPVSPREREVSTPPPDAVFLQQQS